MESRMISRFAPSPTGRMHLGNVWTLLLNALETASSGGAMLLRIEDIDGGRCRPEYVAHLLDDLHWLGLSDAFSADPALAMRQSDRRELYEAVLDDWRARGLCYSCRCSRAELHGLSAPHPEDGHRVYSGTCRPAHGSTPPAARLSGSVRLRVPDCLLTFDDRCLGTQQMNLAEEWGDFVIRRADGSFTYQMACAVDDALTGVDFVLRGRDLMRSSFPQIHVFTLLNRPVPAFAHVPMLVDPDGNRLSKRQKSLDLGQMRQAGFRPEEVLGFLAHLAGQSERPEAASFRELADCFAFGRLPQAPNLIVEEDALYAAFGHARRPTA